MIEPTMGQIIAEQFWRDVFLACMNNPKIIEIMRQHSVETQEYIPDQAAKTADKAVAALRNRIGLK